MNDTISKILEKIHVPGKPLTIDDNAWSGSSESIRIDRSELLGRGSYGNVYKAKDKKDNVMAVKCCKIDATGIPNILEASIMSSFFHPHLNRAFSIWAEKGELFIIQELARIDLSQYTCRDKDNKMPCLEDLRDWCFSIACATKALHIENIIHADIKASNVLLYRDNKVRLTDYTLAVKKWTPEEKFTHNVCTSTHRPLECFLKREWNEKLDIWSLGCTFYEIAYGGSLFPYQGDLEKGNDKDKELKIRNKQRFINCLIDWAERGPNAPDALDYIDCKKFPVEFVGFKLSDNYRKPEMKIFNDLLCEMLRINPVQRPSIEKVLEHPFFCNRSPIIGYTGKRPDNKIPVPEHARVARFIQRYSDNEMVQKLAMKIYCRCNDITNISEHVRAAACTWIASKLVTGDPPEIENNLEEQILVAESEICHNLKFHLHDN